MSDARERHSPPDGAHTLSPYRAALLLVFLVSAGAPAHAAQWYVLAGGADVAFAPQFLTIQAGDSVTFLNQGGNHNAVADDGSFRCAHGCDNDGHGGNGNASSDLWIATVAFPDAGVVGYFCEPHGAPGEGMFGTITVLAPAPPPEPAPSGGARYALVLALGLAAIGALRIRRRVHALHFPKRPHSLRRVTDERGTRDQSAGDQE